MAAIANLIVNVAADTADIKRKMADVDKTLDGFGKSIGKVGALMAGAFTVTAIVSAGKAVIDYAGKLTDLSAKTGISTTGLQKLELAFEQSGVSIDTVTKATSELGARLVKGDSSVVSALTKMGLSVEELKRMKPEDQFIKVADAVGGIQNKGEQLYASKTLFGKGGVELLSALDGKLKETTDKFQDMGLIMSEDTIAAADEFGDKVGMVSKQLLALVASVLTPLLPLLTFLIDKLMIVGEVFGEILRPAIDIVTKVLLSASVAFQRFFATVLEGAQQIPLLGKHLGIAGDGAKYLRDQADKGEKQLEAMYTTTDKVTTSAKKATPAMLGLGGASEEAAKSADKLAKAWRATMNDVGVSQMNAYAEAVKTVAEGLEKLRVEHAGLAPYVQAPWVAAEAATDDYIERIEFVRGEIAQLNAMSNDAAPWAASEAALAAKFDSAGKGFVNTVRGVLRDLPSIFQQSFEGGGGIMGAFKSLGAKLADAIVTPILSKLSSGIQTAVASGTGGAGAIGAKMGGSTGAMIGSTAAGVAGVALAGTLGTTATVAGMVALGAATLGVGVAAVGAYIALKKIFGKGEEKKVNDMRDQFINASGGLHELNVKAVAAGTSLDALLKAKTVKDYEAAMNDLLVKIGTFQDIQSAGADAMLIKQQMLQEATERYGFTVAELGPTMQRQRLAQAAEQLINDFDLLIESGINIDTVIARMSEQINAFIQDAMKTGTEVPESMRPMLEKMVEQGTLTDAAGQKLTDLESLTFGKTLEEMFMGVLQKIEELIAKMGDIPRDITTTHTVVTNYQNSGAPSAPPAPPDSGLGFAGGTHGTFRDFGAGTTVTLHGRERVVTAAEGRAEAGAMSEMTREMKAIRRMLERQPKLIQSAVARTRVRVR